MHDNNTINFKRDKNFVFTGLAIFCSLIALFIFRTSTIGDRDGKNILIYFDIALTTMFLLFCFKYAIPALSGQIALELTDDKLIDHINNRSITWDNIENIRPVDLKFSSGIAVDLVDKTAFLSSLKFIQKLKASISQSSYGTPLVIALQYVSGEKSEIMSAIQTFIDRKNKN